MILNNSNQQNICKSCAGLEACSTHGNDYMRFKCRFCCEKANWFLFGSVHFCLKCYKKFRKAVKDDPKLPIANWMNDPMNQKECTVAEMTKCPVLRHRHKNNPSERCLGCVTCSMLKKAEKEKSKLASSTQFKEDGGKSLMKSSLL